MLQPIRQVFAATVEAKARGLIEPVFGAQQTEKLIEAVRDLDQMQKARDLRPLLATT